MRRKGIVLILVVCLLIILSACNIAPKQLSPEQERDKIVERALGNMQLDANKYDLTELQLSEIYDTGREIKLYKMLIPENGLYLVEVKFADGIIIDVKVKNKLN